MSALHDFAARASESFDTLRAFFETPRHEREAAARRADEFRVEASTVQKAIAADTPEADSQLVVQLTAWDAEIERLLTLPRRRTLAENRQLQAMTVQRNAMHAKLYGAGAVAPDTRLMEFGAVGQRRGFLGPLVAAAGGEAWVWTGAAFVGLLALLGVENARLGHAKHELEQARTDLAAAERGLENARQLNADLTANITAAAHGAQQAAATINQERARANAARDRERRLLHEIQERTANVGEPPAWSLRDDAGGDSAGSGDHPPGDTVSLPR